MNTFLKIIGYGLGILAILLLIGVGYIKTQLPNVGPPPELEIAYSDELLERGAYLANHVMVCMDCHSVRDFSLFSGPPTPNTLGAGGDAFDHQLGFPGKFYAKNITPFSLADWSDGEIYRAITTGVNKDGTPLFPVMPYLNYAKADPDDIKAVIAYLRSLDPIENTIPKAEPDFPMSLILHTIPKKSEPGSIPDKSDLVAYGAYMITIAACADCHTNEINGKKVGLPYAGGREFQMPDGSLLRVANITPHETGIGRWSEEQFIRRFKHYADSTYTLPSVNPGEFQTIMPWMMYAGMEEYDLKAIYHYLRSLEPAENRVTLFEPGD